MRKLTLNSRDKSEFNIALGISLAFHNKENLSGNRTAFSKSFKAVEISPEALIDHILSGKAWTQGYFTAGQRKRENFISAGTLALDLDEHISVEDAYKNSLIRDYAALIHPSPSSTPEHPKTRVVFILNTPVKDVERWETLQRGLIRHLMQLKPDPACKDAARMFYGSDVEGAIARPDLRLPLTLAGQLTIYEAQEEAETRKRKVANGNLSAAFTGKGGTLSQSLIDDVERELGVGHLPTGNKGFVDHAVACPIKHHEHDHERPAAYWNREIHALTCFKCGETYNTHQVAEALSLDIASYYRTDHTASSWQHITSNIAQYNNPDPAMLTKIIDVDMADWLPDEQVNLRYFSQYDITELMHHRAVLVKSAIGTGKTATAVKAVNYLAEHLKQPPRVLVVTHRQTLAENLADRLSDRYVFESYRGLNSAYLRTISRLVICYDSLWKLASIGSNLPEYDLIIIDELEQFHLHLGGDTMRGGEPERAYRVLRQLVKETPRFLGMDAHMSNVSKEWLSSLIADKYNHVHAIDNEYIPDKGWLTAHQHKETAISRALSLVAENDGTVIIPTNSRSMAKKLARMFEDYLDKNEMRVIHGGNSHEEDTQRFIRNINDKIKELRLLIYSPSLGTGVDITSPVRAVIGIFSRLPLAPEDMLQMLGRCRNATERHVWVEGNVNETQNSPDWMTLFQTYERNALITGLHCQFDEAGILAISNIQRSMLKLLAKLTAQRRKAMAQPLRYFVALAQREGYTLNFQQGENQRIKENIKQASEAISQNEKEAVLNAEPVDYNSLEEHRARGTFTADVIAGHERFKIENCIGQTINIQLYDELNSSEKRERVRRYTDIDSDISLLMQYDQQEASEGTLLTQRKHRLMQRKIIRDLFTTLFDDALPEHWSMQDVKQLWQGDSAGIPVLASDIIEQKMDVFLEDKGAILRSYMHWRSDQSQQSVAVLRWLLSRVGLRLESKQIMRDGERFRVYSLDVSSLEKMQSYAESRREHLKSLSDANYSKRGE